MSLEIEHCPIALCTPGQSLLPNLQQCQLIQSNHSTIDEKKSRKTSMILCSRHTDSIAFPVPLFVPLHIQLAGPSGTRAGFGKDGEKVRGNVDRQPRRVRSCLGEAACTHSGHWNVSPLCSSRRLQNRGINKPQYLWNSSVNFHFSWTCILWAYFLQGYPDWEVIIFLQTLLEGLSIFQNLITQAVRLSRRKLFEICERLTPIKPIKTWAFSHRPWRWECTYTDGKSDGTINT